MSPIEKKRAAILALGIVVVAFVDAVALMSVLPVVRLITEPVAFERNKWVNEIFHITGYKTVNELFPLLAVTSLLLLFISSALRFFSEYMTYRMAAACQIRLAGELLRGLLIAPYDWVITKNPTRLTRLIQNDVSLWANSFVRRLGMIANAIVTSVVAVGLVVLFSPRSIVLIIIIMLIMAWFVVRLIKPIISRLSVVHRDASDRIAVAAHEALSGLKDVKMTNSTNLMLNLFVRAISDFGLAVSKNSSLRQIPSILVMLLGQTVLLVVTFGLWWVGVPNGEIASQIALLALASSRLIPAMNRSSAGAGVLWDSLPYMHGIVLLKREIEEANHSDMSKISSSPVSPGWRRVEFEKIAYRYPSDDFFTVNDMTFMFERGKAYGIVGPSGAGKSTLVDLLAGLLPPTEGRILIDGTALSDLSVSSWCEQIGYVSQSPFILDDSLRANVAFGVAAEKIDDNLVWQCLRQAQLEDVTLALEEGLDTCLGDRGLRLSGGQRQRIAIARALYKRPQLLILDEATSALDAISAQAIQSTIAGLHGHLTVVTVAHRLSMIRQCDEILLMEHGHLVAKGGYESLFVSTPLFRELASLDNESKIISSEFITSRILGSLSD